MMTMIFVPEHRSKETFFKGNFIMCKDCIHAVKVDKRFLCGLDWCSVNGYFVCDNYKPNTDTEIEKEDKVNE